MGAEERGGAPWRLYLLTAVSLSIGWGIRGNFGHESGAMVPGALAAMAAALLSGREDWQRRVAFFGFFGAVGWSFGGSMSYMQVIAYTHSGHSLSVWYGFASLFVIGFLWAAMGGAGTALPALLSRERLTEFFAPLSAVFAAWWVQLHVEGCLENHNRDFRHEDPLYWFDTDWLGALVAILAVLVLAAARRRLDSASRLLLYMGVGWWVGFLVLVNLLGLRMTPPRGDNWSGCLGMTAGMLLFFWRHNMLAAVWATLVSGFIGGLAFSGATMMKLVEVTSELETNWHSILEQSYGFMNGIGIGIALWLLAGRVPRVEDEPPVRRWTEAYAVAFVLFVVTYCNLRKNAAEWVKQEAMPDLLYGVPAAWWYNLGYGLLLVVAVCLLARHLRRALPLVPASWVGKGQLLYLVLLWWMVAGNFERAVVAFQPVRLVTEGVIFVNAVLATVMVLLWAPAGRTEGQVPPKGYLPLVRRTALVGLAAAALAVTLDWGIVRALYGDRFAGHAGLHIRFGPHATAVPNPKPGQPHP